MAKLRIMYWKEIPAQVQAEDNANQVSYPLDDRFQQGIDAVSMFDRSAGNDAYLEAWEWGQHFEVPGTAEESARLEADRINREFPENFVARIRDLHKIGKRDTRPGAIDHWRDNVTE